MVTFKLTLLCVIASGLCFTSVFSRSVDSNKRGEDSPDRPPNYQATPSRDSSSYSATRLAAQDKPLSYLAPPSPSYQIPYTGDSRRIYPSDQDTPPYPGSSYFTYSVPNKLGGTYGGASARMPYERSSAYSTSYSSPDSNSSPKDSYNNNYAPPTNYPYPSKDSYNNKYAPPTNYPSKDSYDNNYAPPMIKPSKDSYNSAPKGYNPQGSYGTPAMPTNYSPPERLYESPNYASEGSAYKPGYSSADSYSSPKDSYNNKYAPPTNYPSKDSYDNNYAPPMINPSKDSYNSAPKGYNPQGSYGTPAMPTNYSPPERLYESPNYASEGSAYKPGYSSADSYSSPKDSYNNNYAPPMNYKSSDSYNIAPKGSYGTPAMSTTYSPPERSYESSNYASEGSSYKPGFSSPSYPGSKFVPVFDVYKRVSNDVYDAKYTKLTIPPESKQIY